MDLTAPTIPEANIPLALDIDYPPAIRRPLDAASSPPDYPSTLTGPDSSPLIQNQNPIPEQLSHSIHLSTHRHHSQQNRFHARGRAAHVGVEKWNNGEGLTASVEQKGEENGRVQEMRKPGDLLSEGERVSIGGGKKVGVRRLVVSVFGIIVVMGLLV